MNNHTILKLTKPQNPKTPSDKRSIEIKVNLLYKTSSKDWNKYKFKFKISYL